MTNHPSLRLALRLNAAFSTLSALVLLAAHGELAPLMGVDARLLIAVGVGLALFAVQLLVTARRDDVSKLRAEALRHSWADFAWVIASVVVIVGGWLTPLGDLLLGAVGVPVLALGIAQFRTLPRSNPVTAS
jgi:hypothetical protein